MNKFTMSSIQIIVLSIQLTAQLSITSLDTDYTIDFDNTVSGVNNGQSTGTGFTATPSSGQIDSDGLIVTGLSDGDGTFGGTNTTGDFARGISSGGVTTGGIYAFEVATGNYGLGVQPIVADWTPGSFILKIVNNTNKTILELSINYDVIVYNDQDKANSFNFSYSLDNITYFDIGSLDFTSTAVQDASPTWISNNFSISISNLSLQSGSTVYLRWRGDEVSGSGSMDEFALDNIIINAGGILLGESFRDGDFSNNPTWSGNTAEWSIITDSDVAEGATSSYTLRLSTSGSGTKYISTQFTGDWGSEQSWSFWLGRRSQAATASNQSIVWLYANEADLTSASVDGYRILIGDDSGVDNILLQRIDNGSSTSIISSTDGTENAITDFGFMVRVTRNSGGSWNLYTSSLPTTTGSGAAADSDTKSTNISSHQGSVTDNTYTDFSNGYFGFMAIHSSSGGAPTGAEFDEFRFDNSASSPLPVELTYFNAALQNENVLLTWETATEINNYGFEIERCNLRGQDTIISSCDLEGYQVIGFVGGHGNSNSPKHYEFIDPTPPLEKLQYRLKQIDLDGTYEYYHQVAEIDASNSITNIMDDEIPTEFYLSQNYPNPFNPRTVISFGLAEEGEVQLIVYNTLGQVVRLILDQSLPAGKYSYSFDAGNLASGIYYYKLIYDKNTSMRKMLLMR